MTHLFEGDVKKNLLERSEAEKVFRPWWDTLEDYLLNILIVIGQSVSNFILDVKTIFINNTLMLKTKTNQTRIPHRRSLYQGYLEWLTKFGAVREWRAVFCPTLIRNPPRGIAGLFLFLNIY